MSQSPAPAHGHAASRHGASPLLLIPVGVMCLAFWVIASLLQIQTSEAFILHGPAVTIVPDWAILRQPIDFFSGHLDSNITKAMIWGWGIELIYLVCIVGYEAAHESVKATNRHFAKVFGTCIIVLVGLDALADFQYGTLGSGFWGQFAFAGITAFVVMCFGIVGLRLIELGLSAWSA